MPTKKEKGSWGERVACELLIGMGYGIVEQNWKVGRYEIDLLVMKGNTLVFVEVKTRTKPEADPIKAVNKRKRAHMIASADMYMRMYDIPFEYRFDIVGITGTPDSYEVEYIPDAFMPPLRNFNYKFQL